MGNGEAKELICTTHGHKLRWGNDGGREGAEQRGMNGRKKRDNCNSIINKIYLKNKCLYQNISKKLDPRRNTPRYIIITLAKIKDKERILKAAREKETVTYKGVPIRLSADFSKETLQARRGLKEVFKAIQGKDLHPK